MTAETRRVAARHILEKLRGDRAVWIELLSLWIEYVRLRGRQRSKRGRKFSHVEFGVPFERREGGMTDGAIVELRPFVVRYKIRRETRQYKMGDGDVLFLIIRRDNILMNVVRKIDFKLTLVGGVGKSTHSGLAALETCVTTPAKRKIVAVCP